MFFLEGNKAEQETLFWQRKLKFPKRLHVKVMMWLLFCLVPSVDVHSCQLASNVLACDFSLKPWVNL